MNFAPAAGREWLNSVIWQTQPRQQLSQFWYEAKDGDSEARRLFHRHYSCRQKSHLFVGPGHKVVLVSRGGDALFVWRKYLSDNGQNGLNCAVFRNESSVLSSTLIADAEAVARERWPSERLYTYVDARRVLSPNPGYCFLMAGWKKCGLTAKNLIILEKYPL